ncbi:MAG: hypothetical protein KY459_12835 [Acidobacteria bacterium]|nr:hypothetical protein [Acidobacteriota bacterium]
MGRRATVLVADTTGFSDQTSSPGGDVVSQSIYLTGGKIVETTGPIVIAEFATNREAIAASRRIHQETLTAEGSSDLKVVVGDGEVVDRDFTIGGEALRTSLLVLDAIKPGQFVTTSEIAAETGLDVESELGTLVGRTFVVAAAPQAAAVSPAEPPKPVAGQARPPRASVSAAPTAGTTGGRRRSLMIAGIAGVVLIAVVAVLFLVLRPASERGAELETGSETGDRIAQEAEAFRLFLTRDAAIESAEADAREVVVETVAMMLMLEPATDVVAEASSGVLEIRIQRFEPDGDQAIEPGEPAAPMIQATIEGRPASSPPVPVDDPVLAADQIVTWIAEALGFRRTIPPVTSPASEAYLRSFDPSGNLERLATSLRTEAEQSGDYLSWLRLARLYASSETPSREVEALARAAEITRAGEKIWNEIARRSLQYGLVSDAVGAWARIYEANSDAETARKGLAHAALLAREDGIFMRLVDLHGSLGLHPGDLAARDGDLRGAVNQYYDSEKLDPNDPELAFRVGRIGILRRSRPVANLELDKLRGLGAEPKTSLLAAYIAADSGDNSEAERLIENAISGASWYDSPYTRIAEIRSLMRDTRGTLDAIQRAAEAAEPHAGAIETSPLFEHLRSDPRYRNSLRVLDGRRAEIRERMSGLNSVEQGGMT